MGEKMKFVILAIIAGAVAVAGVTTFLVLYLKNDEEEEYPEWSYENRHDYIEECVIEEPPKPYWQGKEWDVEVDAPPMVDQIEFIDGDNSTCQEYVLEIANYVIPHW